MGAPVLDPACGGRQSPNRAVRRIERLMERRLLLIEFDRKRHDWRNVELGYRRLGELLERKQELGGTP